MRLFQKFLVMLGIVVLVFGAGNATLQAKDEISILNFQTMDEFESYLKNIEKMTDEERDNMEIEKGFLSMARAFKDVGGAMSCNEKLPQMPVECPILSRALNEAGRIILEEKVYGIGYNIVYFTSADQESLLDNLDYNAVEIPEKLPDGVEAYKIEKEEIQQELSKTTNANGSLIFYYQYPIRGLYGYSGIYNYGFFVTVFSGTRSYALPYWGPCYWRLSTAREICVQSSVNLQIYLWGNLWFNLSTSYNSSLSNAHSVSRAYLWYVGWGWRIRGAIRSYHHLNWNGLNPSCTTYANF